MNIYIEIVVILALLSFFVVWRLWYIYTQWRLKANYKPELNLSRRNKDATKGRETFGINGGRELEVTKPTIILPGVERFGERELLQESDDRQDGEPIRETRKNSNRLRKFFGRRRNSTTN
jgi:hypothetical protein